MHPHSATIMARFRKLLTDAKYIILLMSLLFGVSLGLGKVTGQQLVHAFAAEAPSGAGTRWRQAVLHPKIKYQIREVRDPRLVRLTLLLFVHNALWFAVVILLGSVLLPVPFLAVIQEGWLCGAILYSGGWSALIHRIFPHCLIELPCTLGGASIAALIALRLYSSVLHRQQRSFPQAFNAAAMTYAVLLPLLLIAAALEYYGTRLVWGW